MSRFNYDSLHLSHCHSFSFLYLSHHAIQLQVPYVIIDIAKSSVCALPAQSSRYWVIAFESAVDVGDYTDAFSSIMAMNDKEILKDSIQQLGTVWLALEH